MEKMIDFEMGYDKLFNGSSLRFLNIHMFGSCFLVGCLMKGAYGY
jgi:hypothetical protein